MLSSNFFVVSLLINVEKYLATQHKDQIFVFLILMFHFYITIMSNFGPTQSYQMKKFLILWASILLFHFYFDINHHFIN